MREPISSASMLGPYQLLRPLGEGAMGAVWLARDGQLEREVAIKFLRLSAANPVLRERFLREARAAARLNHPNVVTVYQVLDLAEGGGAGQMAPEQMAIVMEFIDGGSLVDYLRENIILDWRQATEAVRDAAAGLAAAHEAGIIHRDIKPANLMRTRKGVVKVADFGLARFVECSAELTRDGSTIGTPAFMAPELCGGGGATAASDLYSLICTYYFLLTSRAPFEGSSPAVVLHQHVHEPFPDARVLAGELPAVVCEILAKGSCKDPRGRFADARELLGALEAVLGGRDLARSTVLLDEVAERGSSHSSKAPTNLPVQLTRFIGRQAEIAEVKELLTANRLVTLLGSGGTGKTRLGLQVAREGLGAYPGGIFFVDLAPLPGGAGGAGGAGIERAVGSAVGVQETPGVPLVDGIVQRLADRQVLLLLDNCEHVIEWAARSAKELLKQCPHLRIVATSREPLGIEGESSYRVPSLSQPEADAPVDARELMGFEAIRLFVDRASAVSRFELTDENAGAVVQICRRLDGIPLAIELAAARVNVLTVQQIAQRLDDRFRLLTTGSRSSLPRQRTLRAMMDWSYDLLSEVERRLLRRISVFAGGWTLEAAERVGAGDGIDPAEVLDLLAHLLDKSLVVSEDGRAGRRYRLLETVRQYALEKLAEDPADRQATRRRHGEYFSELARESEPHLRGRRREAVVRSLEAEHDNVRVAMDFAVESPEAIEAGLEIAGALGRFWMLRGHLSEPREKIQRLLEHGGSPEARARAMLSGGRLASQQGDCAQAVEWAQQALEIFRETGDRRGVLGCIALLGSAALLAGEFARAEEFISQSLSLSESLGQWRIHADSAHNLGLIAQYRGDHRASIRWLEQAVAEMRQLDDARDLAVAMIGLAFALTFGGDYDRAGALAGDALAEFEKSKDVIRQANAHYILARVHSATGDWEASMGQCGRALELLEGKQEKWLTAMTLVLMGRASAELGDGKQAREHCERSLQLARAGCDQRGAAWALAELARIAGREGNRDEAWGTAQEALRIALALPDWTTAAQCLEILAGVAAQSSEPAVWERGGHLFGAAVALRERIGCPVSPSDLAELDRARETLETSLGSERTAATVAEGRQMPLEQFLIQAR